MMVWREGGLLLITEMAGDGLGWQLVAVHCLVMAREHYLSLLMMYPLSDGPGYGVYHDHEGYGVGV